MIDSQKIERDLRVFNTHVADLTAAFNQRAARPDDKEWIKGYLQHMVDVDQYMRAYEEDVYQQYAYTEEEKEKFRDIFWPPARAIDQKNTAAVKNLLQSREWFTISEFGETADKNAWLLVQHADLDHDFQKKVLPILEKLYLIGETRPANYAFLFDRVARSCVDAGQRRPQRYGTQFTCDESGAPILAPTEDMEHLDARRLAMGMKPMAEHPFMKR